MDKPKGPFLGDYDIAQNAVWFDNRWIPWDEAKIYEICIEIGPRAIPWGPHNPVPPEYCVTRAEMEDNLFRLEPTPTASGQTKGTSHE